MKTHVPHIAHGVSHYENFPVASWLCPAHLRPAIKAIYWFARTADDIADEGDAPAWQRLADLAAFGGHLRACADTGAASTRWPQVFGPLADALQRFSLPLNLLTDLLSAFEQDVRKSNEAAGYPDREALLDYCSRSANPVGRLLLHLYRIDEPACLAHSDCICSALQLINFWQDLSIDMPRGRFYLPEQDVQAFASRGEMLAALVAWARTLMQQGAPLVHRIPGRAGWELRLVVQGGLRILEKIETGGSDSFQVRPRLRAWDGPLLIWRALWM